MSWLDRLIGREPHAETRAITGGPWVVPFDHGGGPSLAMTQDRALSLPPVFAALRIIAGTLSTLPIDGYRKMGDSRQPMTSLPALFDLLVTEGQLVPWLHRCVMSMAARGNAVGLVTARDGYEFPTRIDWLNPAEVHCDDTESLVRPDWYWNGRKIDNAEDIVHIPWFPVPGRVMGLSPIGAFATTFSTGLNAQDYGNQWFEGGGFPPGTFKNTAVPEVPQAAADAIKSRLVSAIQSRRPVVFGSDWEYTPITVPPNEAQFIQTAQLSATQVANIYGVLPEDIGGTRNKPLEYATAELNQIERVMAIRPWAFILESLFNSLLPDRQYVKFNLDALVRADLKTRWSVHQVAVGMGARSLDEVRALEDEPPLPDGQGQAYEKTPAPAIGAGNPTTDPTARRTDTGREIWSVPA